MPDTQVLAVFIATVSLLVAVPGPGMLYILARGINQGRLAALASVAGFQAGDAVYVIAGAFGLTALLFASDRAFTLVQCAGIVYLIYLGMSTLKASAVSISGQRLTPVSLQRVFLQGTIVNLLNPKTGLFFLAFLPQFINPDSGSASVQILVLGGVFMLVALVLEGGFALFSGVVGSLILRNSSLMRLQCYVAASIYLLLAFIGAYSVLGAGVGIW